MRQHHGFMTSMIPLEYPSEPIKKNIEVRLLWEVEIQTDKVIPARRPDMAVIILKNMCSKAKHKVSNIVHTVGYHFYTDRIALSKSCKESHQIVDKYSNRHPSKTQPRYYLSAGLPSLVIRFFNNKVDKLRENIAMQNDAFTPTLVTGTTTVILSPLKTCHHHLLENAILFLKISYVRLMPSFLTLNRLSAFRFSISHESIYYLQLKSFHSIPNQILPTIKRGDLI